MTEDPKDTIPAVDDEVAWETADRKRAWGALRESEAKYRAVVERANDGIVVIQG